MFQTWLYRSLLRVGCAAKLQMAQAASKMELHLRLYTLTLNYSNNSDY